jgi:repressor LexA
MKKLHVKQTEILRILKDNRDNPLTIKKLSEEAQIESPGVLYHHLNQLEKKGYLKRNPNNSKDYFVVDSPENSVVYVGKYGLAQCGPNGSILEGDPISFIPIASSLIRFPVSDAFIVEAQGDSMEPKIKEGDIIIAKKQQSAENGEIVVCVFKLEALIKRFSKIDRTILLVSLNQDKYPPLLVTSETDLKIEGIVKNILNYN